MYPAIKEAIPGADNKLQVAFDNGERGTLDIRPFLDFGLFQRLKDQKAFKRVKVAFDTIEWDVGVDLDPEFVYSKVTSAQP